MKRRIGFIGAATNLGLRPYDDGSGPRAVDRSPAIYRELGLVEKLGAHDRGDVRGLPYRDLAFAAGHARNEDLVLEYTHRLADAVRAAHDDGEFVLVAGGECSILLGSLLGLRSRGRIGLAFVDGHSDFAIPANSGTGSVAGMDLAFATGRGDSPLARLGDPLVLDDDVAVIGRRADDPPPPRSICDLAASEASLAMEVIDRDDLAGFFIHLDADVLAPAIMPAVDSPDPGGLTERELLDVLRPLVQHPRALGMDVAIYDPHLDPGLAAGRRLVALLAAAF